MEESNYVDITIHRETREVLDEIIEENPLISDYDEALFILIYKFRKMKDGQ